MRKLALLGLLCGCATVPLARTDLDERTKLSPPASDAASVYVLRPRSVLGFAVGVQVTLDEVHVGTLAPGTYTRVTVRPGEHKLVARSTGRAEQTIVAEPGRSYYVRVGPSWRWETDGGANAHAELIDARTARGELAGCDLIADAAASSIRRIAAEVAGLLLDPVPATSLVAVAALALDPAPVAAAPSAPDLDDVIARVRTARPALSDAEIVAIGARAIGASVRPESERSRSARARALDERLGLAVASNGRDAVISHVLPDSPAAMAGVDPGDLVIEVNGQSTRDHAPREVARLLEEASAGAVTMTLGAPGGGHRTVVLRRTGDAAGAVECRVIASRVLYLRPWILLPTTARRVRDAARGSPSASGRVILDLRDVSAGTVEGARDLVDSFLQGGTIASLVSRRSPEASRVLVATPGTSELEQARLVVLVNGDTRALGEAAAAAVQDHARGAVLGSATAGDGVVGVTRLIEGFQLWVPSARLHRPGGEPIDGRGVVPAQPATDAPVDPGELRDDACPNTVSRTAVGRDALVTRASLLLLDRPR